MCTFALMKKCLSAVAAALLFVSCNMQNPLLTESTLPYGAPRFDQIKTSHYLPAFRKSIDEAKAELDAIIACPDAPTFDNTIVALEEQGLKLERVSSIFYNILEADSNEKLQAVAEKIAPMMNEYSMYVSLNEKIFERVKAVWEARESLTLDTDQAQLLEDSYKGFVHNGANLSPEDKKTFSELNEKLSLACLQFGKNLLAATNAFKMQLTDEADLEGLPESARQSAADAAAAAGMEGWLFDLSYPSYGPFMKYSARRDLRERMYRAYNTRALGGDSDNTEVVRTIVSLRMQIATLLGYETYADYALEHRMAKNPDKVNAFLQQLLAPSLPAAERETAEIFEFAKANGFEDSCLREWDFSYWAERYRAQKYDFNEELLKPYFRLENVIPAVFDLAGRLYGLQFEERPDIPGYHEDVKVYDVKDENGRHMALFYADFFPRASKRGGAWMTEFRGQSIVDGVELRPFISIVTNFTKPTSSAPSLITHDELTTFLHEFGHALHGMLAEGRYGSLTGTNVARDFVELPSQIMENWAYEPEYLNTFARHYQTGELIPQEYIDKIVASQNYLAAYYQVRQLRFGILDMAWYDRSSMPEEGILDFERKVLAPSSVLPMTEGCAISPSFNHIFAGGYSAGYYSYKWAEVLEADAFSLFREKGIFNREVSGSFRDNILSRGGSEDADILYRRFRGHDPEPEALLRKLGITR